MSNLPLKQWGLCPPKGNKNHLTPERRTMLFLDNVTYTYPFCDKPAVYNITLQAEPGTINLITGPSGSGKSTLIRLMNGLVPHYFKGSLTGKILVNRADTTFFSIQEIAQKTGTLFQDPEAQFFALDVLEEISIALRWQGLNSAAVEKRLSPLVQEFGVESILSRQIAKLSEGQKQKVGLVSIMAQNPEILVLDEPSANLDPDTVQDLAKTLLQLKEKGKAVVVIDHRLYWLKGIADHVHIIDKGCIAESLEAKEFYARPDLADKYGLRSFALNDVRTKLPDIKTNESPGVVSTENLTFGYGEQALLMEDYSQNLPQGKVIGCIGPNGTGKTTLAMLLCGLLKPKTGKVLVDKRTVSGKRLTKHNGLVLQNTDYQLHMRSVRAELDACSRHISKKDRTFRQDSVLEAFGLSHLVERHPQSLSGGERQRLVLACETLREPKVLILDEPTSGLDGKNMQATALCIKSFAEKGTCVLVITHDLELLERVCDYALHFPLIEG